MVIRMDTRSNRRDFIKGLAYAGTVLPRVVTVHDVQ